MVGKDSRSRRVMCVSICRDLLEIGRPPAWGRVTLTRLVFPREDVLCVIPNVYLIVLPCEDDLACERMNEQNRELYESQDPIEIHRPPSWGRDAKAVYSRLVPRQVLPHEDLGVFPLPRNNLGKGFRELGGRPWTLESATSLSQGAMWPIPKTHSNLGRDACLN